MMLYIFNLNEQLQAVLKNDGTACPYYDAVHTEKLTGENTFTFTVPADHPDSQYVVEGNLVAFRDLDQNWQLFEIKRVTDVHGDGLTRTAYCEHAFYELIDDFIEDVRPTDCSASFALIQALSGTRWSVGDVADLGLNSTNYYYESALSAIQKVASVWGGELRFRVVVTGGVIFARYIDLLARRGADIGKQFAYTKDIKNIEREVDLTQVATALYGRGKGVEVGEGYGRRLDFADVVWTSPPNPVDKPLGQEWVGDPEALARWGRPGGRHRFGTYDDPEETDAAKLLQKTWEALQERKNPRITYRLDVADLERLSGYEHEKVRLGDTVRVIDQVFSPPLLVEARIIEINRDLLRPENTRITLGNFAPTIADENLKVQETVQVVRDRQGVWDTATPFTGPVPTSWLEGIIDTLQNEVRAGNGSVTLTDNNGILIVDNPETPTKALRLLGGLLAISNEKDTNGNWIWRTFGTGDGFTADEINAGQIQTSLVKIFGNSNFYWDGDYLYIVNPANLNEQIRLSKEGIRFTKDGGQTWLVAMDFDGLQMEGQSQDGYTHYVGDGVKVYDETGNLVGHLGSFETLGDQTATFSRSSVAYKQDGTQVAANVPRFEAGKFGQAMMVEEGTTNLLTNPSFEGTYASGVAPNWTAYASGSATGNYAESVDALAGGKAQRITRTGGAAGDRWGIRQTSSAIGGTNATISVYIKVLSFTSGAVVRLYGDFTGGPYGVGQARTITANDVGKWIRLQGSATVDSTDTCSFYVWIEGANADILVDCAQVEAKPHPTSFIDTTRSPETLTIPGSVLNPQEGTVECWVYFPPSGRWSVAGQMPTIFWAGSNSTGVSANQIYADAVVQGTLRLVIYDSSGAHKLIQTTSAITSGWHYLAYKWDGTGPLAICVDGVKQSTTTDGTGTGVCSSVERFTLGFNGYDNVRQIDSLIDDLRISSKARTDAEISAAYSSNAPLPVDEYTTWKSSFDGHLRNEVPVKKYGLMLKRGTIKLEAPSPDEGIQIYDASNNLRTHIGQYAAGKYGAKVINGEIYSTVISTGMPGATNRIELSAGFFPLTVYYNNKEAVEMYAVSSGGYLRILNPTRGYMVGWLCGVDDARGVGVALEGFTGAGWCPLYLTAAPLYLEADYINAEGRSVSNTYMTVWGDLHVTGNLSAGGSKPARQVTQNYGERYLYARESPDVRYIIEGKAQLVNGECKIDLDPIFLECIESDTDTTPWLIHLTPMADVSLYVAEIGANYIVVKESTATSNDTFFWSLSATRRGYAGVWLEQPKSDEDVLTSNWEDELGVVIDEEPESSMG